MKEKISVLFKILIIIVTATGLILNFRIAPIKDMILYFTILSNLMCLVFYAVSMILYFIKKLKKNDTYYILKGMITMCITLTLAVYNIVIKNVPIYQTHILECGFVHIYAPILIMLDYVIFGEKGNLKPHFPFVWSIFPLVYTLFCFGYMGIGGTFMGDKYPYFYMNFEEFGVLGVLNNCLIIYVLFIVYGYVICFLDMKSSELENNQGGEKANGK